LFSRDEIQAAVWGAGTHVDFEQGLNYCIKEIRAALGDRAEAPVYVETLARRGYRFIAPVEIATTATASPPPPPPAGRRRGLPSAWIAAFIVSTGAIALGFWHGRSSRATRLTVAVLPFENLTGSPAEDAFTAGLTEEATVQLGQVQPSQLAVLARTTARSYTQRPHPIGALADDFGVDYVLEGSVRRCVKHARLRVTARLVRAANRRQVWSETLQESLDDPVEMQRSLGRAVATRVGAALAEREPARLAAAVPTAFP
jgi:TolB-like protein